MHRLNIVYKRKHSKTALKKNVFISNKHAAFHFTIQQLESCELLMDYCELCYKI